MDAEDALRWVEEVLFQKGKQLSDLERIVFLGSWDGKGYDAIHQECGFRCSLDHLKLNVGYQLWKRLTEVFGQKVLKKTLKGRVIETLWMADALPPDVQKLILGQSYSYRDFTTDAGYLYSHLEELRETAPADELLNRFNMLFVEGDRYPEAKVLQALHRMMESSWIEQEFDIFFNRCCYILINYWWLKRSWELTHRLIQLINTAPDKPTASSQNTVLKTPG